MSNKRIKIYIDEFQKLTNGDVVTIDGVDIILDDIGWSNMVDIIQMNEHFTKNK